MSTDPAAPRLAIIIPIYRHSALVIEAIETALSQTVAGGIRLILVNDGCPFRETDEVCRDYALAYPGTVTYLRKPNGGLSDARNCGIEHVLAHLPSVEAVYMLDADNRLRAGALSRAMAALDADPAADWVYPNIDMFGLSSAVDFGGNYSLLIHSDINICEAGSLFRRRVFEKGIRFDTGFRMGWEDWDFFLTAAQHGLRGRNLEDFGFHYRKRPESMLAESDREQESLRGALRRKHKPLYSAGSLLDLEQREAPRYAIFIADRREVLVCVDPDADGATRITFDQFDEDYWKAQVAAGRYRTPPYNIVLSSDVFDALAAAGLLHWLLWKFETICDTGAIAVLAAAPAAGERLSVATVANAGKTGLHRNAVAIALPAKVWGEVLRDKGSLWIDSLAQSIAEPPVTALDARFPDESPMLGVLRQSTAVFDLLSIIHRMRSSPWRAAAQKVWGHRSSGVRPRGQEHLATRGAFDHAPVFPRLADGRRHVGFLLPLAEFGGVEKVALQIARGLRAQGWVPHAFVLASNDIAASADWSDVFESTNLLADPAFSTWGGGRQSYLGTDLPKWAESGRHGTVLGMLHWLDAVINFHGGSAAAIMGRLRRMGIRTANSLHLNDLTATGRPVGNTYLGLAYEHAFDLFIPCSEQLGDWLHGQGVPRDKIVPVRNGPGFRIDPDISARGIAARNARPADSRLRVLFLGRLDRQKGLDRLAAVMRRSQAEKLPVDWRVIGKAVLAADAPPLPSEVAAVLEPALSRPEDLAAAYAWADVVVLLSRYEGLPLTVLEAMRAGAVVVATDAGATSEVLQDGVNGLLLPQTGAEEACLAGLRRLAADRAALRALSDGAVATAATLDWDDGCRNLAQQLAIPANLAQA